ncbi:Serpin domain containing protein [Asbolus verrucosus]|uniref:Serpin domain containing protein n=1 Tax=Asbolus verrucosus TaxID=1661398 RepID=A0A482VEP7_ASBVE|nr:Serpin domain containing protein [Asbolus verrucosus]
MYRFPHPVTTKRDFYKSATDILQIDTMFMPSILKHFFNYSECEKLNTQFVELPFKGESASVVIVLPNEKGLATLENEIESLLSPRQLYRTLPSWNDGNEIKLFQLGVHKVLDDKEAALSGIAADKGDLIIDNVIQKTFIDVNEKSVEAAVASNVSDFYSDSCIDIKV